VASILSLEAQQLLKLLEDGQWHPYDEIRDRMSAVIAPGKAIRFFEQRAAQRPPTRSGRQVTPISEAAKILSGQRGLATHTICSLKRRQLETTGDGITKLIRIRPDILLLRQIKSECQASPPEISLRPAPAAEATAPQEEDDEDDLSAMAFFSEPQVRAMIATEVANAVELSQQRLQSWLGARLVNLERLIRQRDTLV